MQKKNHVVGGDNGSYLVADKSETIVSLSDECGKIHYVDIFYTLKKVTNGRRFTRNFIDDLNSKIENVKFCVEVNKSVEDCIIQEIKKVI